MQNYNYPNIDMQRTGALLKKKVEEAGFTVKELQEKLRLSCPQPIYRWFKGKVLPSINHLYALSQLLHVHMEELLVPESQMDIMINIRRSVPCVELTRMYSYLRRLQQVA
jgi:transcriptional regulator with XRE-family HTH domain